MKIYLQGEKGKAICHQCGPVSTTFEYRDVALSSGGHVEDILVAVCDHCDSAVATPPQSSAKIKQVRQRMFRPLEASLPIHYHEVLEAACYLINPDIPSNLLRKTLILHYINELAENSTKHTLLQKRLAKYQQTEVSLLSGKKKRLSMKISQQINTAIELLTQQLEVDKTMLLKSIALLIKQEVVEQEDKSIIKKINRLSRIVHA